MATTLEEALAAVDVLGEEVRRLWGYNPRTLDAKPLAIQLRDRIEYGQILLTQAERQGKDAEALGRIKRRIARLRQRYAQALEDPEDQRRCAEFEAVWERYQQAIEAYKEVWDGLSPAEKAAHRCTTRGV